jgi:hypothetical protein
MLITEGNISCNLINGKNPMDPFKENTIQGLKDLIINCRIAETILRNFTLESDNVSLRKIFLHYADLNSSYIDKLIDEIIRLGGNVTDIVVEKFSCWQENIEFKDKLKICENSIKNVVNHYKEFSLREDILNEVIPVISRQYVGEKEAQETIKNINSTNLSVS